MVRNEVQEEANRTYTHIKKLNLELDNINNEFNNINKRIFQLRLKQSKEEKKLSLLEKEDRRSEKFQTILNESQQNEFSEKAKSK
jgi:hypothetical protein